MNDAPLPPFAPTFTKKWYTAAYDALDTSLPSLSATGKNVVITGGGTGIGAAAALRFAQAGASSVSILGRTVSTLNSTKSFIEAKAPNSKVYIYIVDVVQEKSVKVAFKTISGLVGKIHVFVNNAGYVATPAPIKDADSDDWWKTFEINIKGSFYATQAFLNFKAVDATLINVASAAAHVLYGPDSSSYDASKAGGVRFFADVQLENPDLRVVSLQPGLIQTAMAQKVGLPGSDNVSLPAATMVWLASPEAAFLKGKFIWCNWDVEEMKARAEEIARSELLTMKLMI